jgi:hypothetical protein
MARRVVRTSGSLPPSLFPSLLHSHHRPVVVDMSQLVVKEFGLLDDYSAVGGGGEKGELGTDAGIGKGKMAGLVGRELERWAPAASDAAGLSGAPAPAGISMELGDGGAGAAGYRRGGALRCLPMALGWLRRSRVSMCPVPTQCCQPIIQTHPAMLGSRAPKLNSERVGRGGSLSHSQCALCGGAGKGGGSLSHSQCALCGGAGKGGGSLSHSQCALCGGAGKGGGGAAWDQFGANEQMFGVQTSFDENFYTTALDKGNGGISEKDAERIAREIEGMSTNNSHQQEERNQQVGMEVRALEEGRRGTHVTGRCSVSVLTFPLTQEHMDEEDKYSSVMGGAGAGGGGFDRRNDATFGDTGGPAGSWRSGPPPGLQEADASKDKMRLRLHMQQKGDAPLPKGEWSLGRLGLTAFSSPCIPVPRILRLS